jgi:hypothetical protein
MRVAQVAATRNKTEWRSTGAPAAEPPIKRAAQAPVAVEDTTAIAASISPARELQEHLSRSIDGAPGPRWSRRKTLLFVVAVCGGSWLALALGLRSLIR